MEIIETNYPNVKCHAVGDGYAYGDIIHDGGDPIPPQAELDALLMPAEKEIMWQKIKAYRDNKLSTGGYPTASGWFHSDSEAQLNYEDLYKVKGLLAQMPPNYWKKMDGTFIVMTEAIVDSIFSSKIQQKTAIFTKAEEHRQLMMASNDPLNYNYTTGWPAVYGG